MKTVFESGRINFVTLSESLVKDYLAMINDIENVARYIGHRTLPYTEKQENGWVRKKLEEKAPVFSMLEKAAGAFIGNIELMNVQDASGELGISITHEKQDLGYGTEAIPAMIEYGKNRLGLNRIYLKVYTDNPRALHVYEKCGFREYNRTETDIFMEIIC